MPNTKAIEDLINGYATSEDSSFLIPNVTEDFLAVRPSGNPISAKGLVGMFDSKDLVAESSELIKTHKIEIYGEMAYAVFTLNEIFSYKGNQNKDLSTYTLSLIHISEPTRQAEISYAVFCLKKKIR